MQKDREREILCPFAVGANCVRPRAFTERPYEDDFLSAGKTCFMEGTRWGAVRGDVTEKGGVRSALRIRTQPQALRAFSTSAPSSISYKWLCYLRRG